MPRESRVGSGWWEREISQKNITRSSIVLFQILFHNLPIISHWESCTGSWAEPGGHASPATHQAGPSSGNGLLPQEAAALGCQWGWQGPGRRGKGAGPQVTCSRKDTFKARRLCPPASGASTSLAKWERE